MASDWQNHIRLLMGLEAVETGGRTFFDTTTLYREPQWLRPPRGPNVSMEAEWYPVVTMLQLAVDMAIATTSAMGYGHVFAPEHYIDGWQ